MWTPLEALNHATKSRLHCRCACGVETTVRVSDLLSGASRWCRSCASRRRAAAVPKEERVRRATHASAAAAKASTVRRLARSAPDPLTPVASAARQRCRNKNNVAYKDYGGRGIQFLFPSSLSMTEWVTVNLGPKPTPAHSIDRIDNNRHYEPGNLRWATKSEQARNKRAYRRSETGERIRRLQAKRPDLTYETLRCWVANGLTDEEIEGRRKYARTSV